MKKYIHIPGEKVPNVTQFGTIQVKWANDGGPPWNYHCVCVGCRTGSDRNEAELLLGCPTCIAEAKEKAALIEQGNASRIAARAKYKEDRRLFLEAEKAAILARKAARLAKKGELP